jgi:polysaccharide biosynthesis protein PelC
MPRTLLALLTVAAFALGGCAVMDRGTNQTPLERGARWAVLPIVNHTDVPQAGLRAEAVTEGLLRARGVNTLLRYPPNLNPESLFEPSERRAQVEAQDWARKQNVRYGLLGAVDEWRYKVGVDGEPAVGVTLQVIDLQSGDVVWSAVGARSGWSREPLSGVARKLIRDMLASARIE